MARTKEKKTSETAPKKRYTYGDYLKWPEDERWEIIEGEAFDMTPAPLIEHQRILGALFLQFGNFLEGKPCEAFLPPFDVRLPRKKEKEESIDTVVQPDLVVICDKKKLDQRGCRGAPDLAVEILSPSTASKDYIKKLNLYEKHKVKEYWIIHPAEKLLSIFRLNPDGRYGKPSYYSREDKAPVELFPDLKINLSKVFPE